jgi:phosphoserine phosphatase
MASWWMRCPRGGPCTTTSDIALWKGVQDPIHKDDLFRAFAGCTLMKGARELVEDLRASGVFVAIVSAGVDLFVGSIAAMLKVDDWIANGFVFDDDGWLTDAGVCRLHASGKGDRAPSCHERPRTRRRGLRGGF